MTLLAGALAAAPAACRASERAPMTPDLARPTSDHVPLLRARNGPFGLTSVRIDDFALSGTWERQERFMALRLRLRSSAEANRDRIAAHDAFLEKQRIRFFVRDDVDATFDFGSGVGGALRPGADEGPPFLRVRSDAPPTGRVLFTVDALEVGKRKLAVPGAEFTFDFDADPFRDAGERRLELPIRVDGANLQLSCWLHWQGV